MVFFILLFRSIICFLLIFVRIFLLGDNILNNHNKIILFECGVLYKNISRVSFSLRFFLIVIIFLIFDIEIILFIPVRLLSDFLLFNLSNLIIYIIFILLGGLLYE